MEARWSRAAWVEEEEEEGCLVEEEEEDGEGWREKVERREKKVRSRVR